MHHPGTRSCLSRRGFVRGASAASLALLAGCANPFARAQPASRVVRIGYLSPGDANTFPRPLAGFREGLRELGYVEGQNVFIERRYAEGRAGRLAELAAELVALPVDVIVAGGGRAIQTARDATNTIPIVGVFDGDPVASGLVASLARPGGNVTGPSNLTGQLTQKRLGLLKESLPGLARVAVLLNATGLDLVDQHRDLQRAAQILGLQLQVFEMGESVDLDAVFESVTREQAEALYVGSGSALFYGPSRVIAPAAQHRLPAMYARTDEVEIGGLMAYGSDRGAHFRRAAVYVDKILKGTKPADIPVEQAMLFEFLVNRPAARALGLTFPESIILQVTGVVE